MRAWRGTVVQHLSRRRSTRSAKCAVVVCAVALVSTFTPTAPARAQSCTGTSNVSCTISTSVGAFQKAVGGTTNLAVVTTPSGSAGSIFATTVGGSATFVNDGQVAGTVQIRKQLHTTDPLTTASVNVTNNGFIGGTLLGVVTTFGDVTVVNHGTVVLNVAARTQGAYYSNATAYNYGTAGSVSATIDGPEAVALAVNYGTAQTVFAVADFSAQSAKALNFGTTASLSVQTGVGYGGTAEALNAGTVTGPITATGNGAGTIVANRGEAQDITSSASGQHTAITINSGIATSITTEARPTVVPTAQSGNAITRNSGVVNGNVTTTSSDGRAKVVNTGQIFGTVRAEGVANVVNSGLINALATSGVAIDLSQAGAKATSLTLTPTSRVLGEILLANGTAGPGTTVNLESPGGRSSVLTFGNASCHCGLAVTGATVHVAAGGMPYVVGSNSVATVDATPFGLADRNMLDVTRAITSQITSELSAPAPQTGDSAAAFLATTAPPPTKMGTALLGLDTGSTQDLMPLAASQRYADGTMIWTQGFGGERLQNAEPLSLRSINTFYGGMIGGDRLVREDLRLGAFVGGGGLKSIVSADAGSTTSAFGFAGLYGRYAMGASFLDFTLLGGGSSNATSRQMSANLSPSGQETATGSYRGWFLSPELAYGFSRSIGAGFTLTPVVRARYLAAGFGGYGESGSEADMNVASRLTSNFEERGELNLSHGFALTPTTALRLTGTFGLVAQQRVGDTNVDAVLLGQSLAFAVPGQNSRVGLYTGAAFDLQLADRIAVFGTGEYAPMSDASRTLTFKGGMRVAF